jgi:hypothetical protein
VQFGVVAAFAVLPGAEKEEESQDGQIGDGFLLIGCGWEVLDGGVLVHEELEGDTRTRVGGRSCLLLVRNWRYRRESVLPRQSWRGSGGPTLEKIWATE